MREDIVLKFNPKYEVNYVEETSVVFEPEYKRVFVLDKIGGSILNQINGIRKVSEIKHNMRSQFWGDEIEKDIEEFIEIMKEKEIVIENEE